MKSQTMKIQNKIAVVLFVGAAIMLYTWMNTSCAAPYNGGFEKINTATNLPAGWQPISSSPYTYNFAKSVSYRHCHGSGRKPFCHTHYAVQLQRKEVGPRWQYLRLNFNRLTPVVAGGTYKYSDITSCTARMPVIVEYFDANKVLVNQSVFTWEGILSDAVWQWKAKAAWFTIPAGIAYINMSRTIPPNSLVADKCWWDDVKISRTQ